VLQRDSALEGMLHRRGARNREVHRPELRLGKIFVVMMFFVVVSERSKR
jgi:hypothetical protein